MAEKPSTAKWNIDEHHGNLSDFEDLDDSPSDKATDGAVQGMKCEVKRVYDGGRPDGLNVEWMDELPDRFKRALAASARAEYALLLRTELVLEKQKLHSVVIQSPLLKEVLKEILKDYPSLSLSKDNLTFYPPFKPFVYCWETFNKACEQSTEGENAETIRHLRLLRDALEPDLKETFEAIRNFNSEGTIEFEHLWTIFQPGSIAVAVAPREKGHVAFKVKKTEVVDRNSKKYFTLSYHTVDFDGVRFGRTLKMAAIPQYEGAVGRKDLAAFPFEHHPDRESIRAKLVARGRVFEQYAGIHYKSHEGMAEDNSNMNMPEHRFVRGRIVIDAKTYFRFNNHMEPSLDTLRPGKREYEEVEFDPSGQTPPDLTITIPLPRGARFRYNNPRDEYELREQTLQDQEDNVSGGSKEELTDEDRLICKSQVRGYSLKLKKWLVFDLDDIKDISWNTSAFDSLALPGDYKYLLLAFARSQTQAEEQFDDVIEGKGRGMVLLLEGPPGTGKTLTVESVAEEMRVPVYSISAGYLSTHPMEVQQRLEEAFEIATAWNAVILLDEADIFLEKRSILDLSRNQLVSVFLQSLEYYTGTIFLTTNRVETIDDAFNSRIHLSLPYPTLTRTSRRKVWANFLASLHCDTSHILQGDLDDLATRPLNGRQIKNAVKMAGLLAAVEKGPLRMKHIQTVVKIMGTKGTEEGFGEGDIVEGLVSRFGDW